MNKSNLIILTKNKNISTIQYGYEDFNINVSDKIPSCSEIILNKNFYLIKKDIKTILGYKLFLINFFRKRWSLLSEFKRLFISNTKSPYKFILPTADLNPVYGLQLNSEKKELFKFHTIRIVNQESLKISLIFFYILSFIKRKNYSIKTIICINTTNLIFIKTIQNLFPKSKIYIRFYDSLNSGYININAFNKLLLYVSNTNISVETYSLTDSIKYKINYYPNTASISNLSKFQNKSLLNNKNSVFFLGSVNSERLKSLIQIIKILTKNNVKICFYLFLDKNNDNIIKLNQLNSNLGYQAITILKKYINYNEYIKLLSQYNIIIDFYRFNSDEGYSFRIPEAIILNKKIITNRQIIKYESFYKPQNILLIEKDQNGNITFEKDNLQIFLSTLLPDYTQNDVDLFSSEQYLITHNMN